MPTKSETPERVGQVHCSCCNVLLIARGTVSDAIKAYGPKSPCCSRATGTPKQVEDNAKHMDDECVAKGSCYVVV